MGTANGFKSKKGKLGKAGTNNSHLNKHALKWKGSTINIIFNAIS
jgi:hypothetical protein